jgi:hypothetical protein
MRAEVRRALLGLAIGLALAVRPTGSAEVSRVNGAPKARLRAARMRSTVEAGGADPDNAWRSGPVLVLRWRLPGRGAVAGIPSSAQGRPTDLAYNWPKVLPVRTYQRNVPETLTASAEDSSKPDGGQRGVASVVSERRWRREVRPCYVPELCLAVRADNCRDCRSRTVHGHRADHPCPQLATGTS